MLQVFTRCERPPYTFRESQLDSSNCADRLQEAPSSRHGGFVTGDDGITGTKSANGLLGKRPAKTLLASNSEGQDRY